MATPAQILRAGNGNALSHETTIRGRALQKLDKLHLNKLTTGIAQQNLSGVLNFVTNR